MSHIKLTAYSPGLFPEIKNQKIHRILSNEGGSSIDSILSRVPPTSSNIYSNEFQPNIILFFYLWFQPKTVELSSCVLRLIHTYIEK